jgi:hypothetical protein
MTTATAITEFVRRRTAADFELILEQKPYAKGVGRVSRLQIILAAAARMFGLEPPEIDCGIESDGMHTAVYAYPSDLSVHYDVGVTHGSLTETVREEVSIRELVSFSLTSTEQLKYPVKELESVTWMADVWGEDGAVVADPALDVSDGSVTTSAPIYGTAEVIYTTTRDTHGLRVGARQDAVENVFQSVFWAHWNGGVELLVIEPPEGAEEDYAFRIECTGGDVLDTPDDPSTPTAPSNDRTITLDYCEDFS